MMISCWTLAEYTLDRNSSTQSNLISLFTLNPRHQGNLLWTLYDVWAVFLSYQLAVLEKALVAWKTVGEIAKGDQSEAPDASTTKFTLVFHSVRAIEDATAVKPALHELTLVPGIIERDHHKYRIESAQVGRASYIEPSGKFITPRPEQTPLAKEPSLVRKKQEKRRRKEKWKKVTTAAKVLDVYEIYFSPPSISYRIAFHLAVTNVPDRASDLFDSTRQCNDFHLLE